MSASSMMDPRTPEKLMQLAVAQFAAGARSAGAHSMPTSRSKENNQPA
jgi:hypothetical protein